MSSSREFGDGEGPSGAKAVHRDARHPAPDAVEDSRPAPRERNPLPAQPDHEDVAKAAMIKFDRQFKTLGELMNDLYAAENRLNRGQYNIEYSTDIFELVADGMLQHEESLRNRSFEENANYNEDRNA
ncbi:hypothetical protein QR680_007848 [Steinernema hermaphroditum]|uniref:Uncharacterized protein n=1 Tax=Steinernema hermaphroditum TaxID=289476 RepID=A0AA39IEF3_9BILA|nr:hypothetical protein QR680_007848 [Steinernema hermaphroditum]